MRAALASLLGGLFGIGLILLTNSAQAQTLETADVTASTTASDASDPVAVLRRLGDATLRSLRGAEPAIRGLRLNDGSSEPSSGLRWQLARMPGLRSEGDIPRNRDLISLGVQVRF
jgi:hypothetical protein